MKKPKTRYWSGRLPHILPFGGTFFITYRLFGSIPSAVIRSFKMEYESNLMLFRPKELEGIKTTLSQLSDYKFSEKWFDNNQLTIKDLEKIKIKFSDLSKKKIESILRKKKTLESKRHFKNIDDFLDSNLQEPFWLRIPAIAQLNFDNLKYYEKDNYKLWAFTIMPNHIHLLVTHIESAPIFWKILQNQKSFSAKKSNEILKRKGQFWERESFDHLVRKGEFDRILLYILNNPVKAGFVKNWKDWQWSYCHPDLLKEF